MSVRISFIADIVDWLNGLGKSEEALGDNVKGLEDVMRKGILLGDSLGKTSSEIARDFSEAFGVPLDRAKDAVREVLEETEKLEDVNVTATAENVGKIAVEADDVSGRMSALGDVARDVLEGDFASAAEGAVSSLGGLALFAGAGGVLAAALAAGIGSMVGNWIGEWQRAAEESEARANAWAENYIKAGGRVLDSATVVANGMSILTDRYSELEKNTKDWGVSQETALAAMAGSPSAIGEVQASLEDMRDEMERQQRLEMKDEWAEYSGELQTLQSRLADAEASFKILTGEMDGGAVKADTFSFFLRDLAENTAGATTKIDEFGDRITTLPDGTEIYIDAQTGQATTNVEDIKNRIYSVPQTRDVEINVNTARARANFESFIANISGRNVSVNGSVRLPDWQ